MEQSNFSSINRELTDDISGTEAEPVLVRVMKGKGGLGTVFVIKIGTLYFEMWQKRGDTTFWPRTFLATLSRFGHASPF